MSKPQATVTITMSVAAACAVRNALDSWADMAQGMLDPEAGDADATLERNIKIVHQVLAELS